MISTYALISIADLVMHNVTMFDKYSGITTCVDHWKVKSIIGIF